MVNRRLLAVLFVVMSLTLSVPCVAQQSSAEKEILDLEEKMNAAYAANDLPTYFGRMSLTLRNYSKVCKQFVLGCCSSSASGVGVHSFASQLL